MSEDVTLGEFSREDATEQNDSVQDEEMTERQDSKLDSLLSELLTGGRPTGGGLDKGDYISIGGTQVDSEGYIDLDDLVYIPEDYFESVEKTQLRKHDILVVKDGANTGDVAIAWESDDNIVTNEHLFTLRAKSEINPPYLFYYLLSHQGWKQINGTITGSAQEGINQGFTGKVDVEYPPLEEQRKIATVLSTVDQAIQKTEEVIEQTRYIKQGLVNEIVINGIASESYKPMRVGPHEFKIPEHWKIVSITEACENLDNKRIPVSQSNREDMQGEIPYYGASGCVDYVDDYLFNEPLILLAEDGENLRSRTQRVAFKITGKSWINNHAHVLRPKSGFELDYLVEYLERLDYRPYVSGSAQPKLNQTMMNKITVPKPPVEEQEQIASVLNDFKSCIEDGQSYRDQLKRLKQGLMQDLLSGTVRTHDTDIEVLDDVLAHG